MIWNGVLLWNPQMSASANMAFIVLPILLHYLAAPTISFYFFCKCCSVLFRRREWLAYIICSILLTMAQAAWNLSGMAALAPEILLFAVCGCILLRGRWRRALAVSVLAVSVSSICGGIAQWVEYWALWRAGSLLFSMVPFDLVKELLYIFLTLLIVFFILKTFSATIRQNDGQVLLLLSVPAFFISLVERITRDSIYGSTLVADSERGLLFPVVDHGGLFFLQFFACACLFLILAAFRKITGAIQAEQTIQLLEQQKQAQEIYVQEALSRYAQTRAFRHDIKNHLVLLAGLIGRGQIEEAREYLEDLDQACGCLTYPVQTGNAAVDALLGSKLSIVEREGIPVQCQLRLPPQTGISDMDWCIALANAIDNAAFASRVLLPKERYIHITGKKKGNFYLISIENRCEKSIQEIPDDGIGLSNIRAAVQKYQGTVKIEVQDGIFRLDLLWVLPETEDDPICNS